MKKLALLLALACVALGALAGGGSASPAAGPAPVMTGLHNPRGLAIDNHGSLYVAEAGQGGSAPCAVFSDGMTKCYGPTGRISRLKNGVQSVVADGLPSNAPAGGNGASARTTSLSRGATSSSRTAWGTRSTRAWSRFGHSARER